MYMYLLVSRLEEEFKKGWFLRNVLETKVYYVIMGELERGWRSKVENILLALMRKYFLKTVYS
jgi:hypothetical protein